MIEHTRCAGVMIGRGALSMPWIFRDTWSYLTTGSIPAAPSLAAKCQLMRDHFYNICRYQSERNAVVEFRKRVSWYAKQMHPCRMLKEEMRSINSAADFDRVVSRFLDWRATHDEDVRQGRAPADELVDEAA
jgi:tRNA-dihydrouridine synthase B